MPEAADRTLLGFDLGTHRIGVAIGQELTQSARPLTTIQRKNRQADWQQIETLLQEWGAEAAVVGIPLQQDGSEQEMSRLSRKFSNQLRGRFNLTVYEVDERLTSVEAESIIRNNRGQRRSMEERDIDAIAATRILQSWFNL
ncbi:MAG: Holliday junction resolvase RuvX [Gammaproteobacteria bacterium]|jgi:putative Holliday junction resolvase|nr:Holliday junction resolvase RuvX [Gammaproteobacteria bacterium]MBT4607860.1 Holliday junction resolvase RuvX [Thiotrichales bacterium]MBT3471251.1 Holliday junction resolvase RuvX [Gammaproteobacteria bacterium]MBT3966296.1 Holliday junction resolvase RuvX [Gammaproteobacteria bacterium]MBT4079791.1 Holliday junction resolvase RuvX [Gammaproteobacteria bacterium]